MQPEASLRLSLETQTSFRCEPSRPLMPRGAVTFRNKLHSSARVMKGNQWFHWKGAGPPCIILHHTLFLLDRELLSKVDFYVVILNSFWWKLRDKRAKYRCILGNSERMSQLLWFMGTFKSLHRWNILAQPVKKKKKVWTGENVASLLQSRECINVLEIKLSSADSDMMNQNRMISFLRRLIARRCQSLMRHIRFKNKCEALQSTNSSEAELGLGYDGWSVLESKSFIVISL